MLWRLAKFKLTDRIWNRPLPQRPLPISITSRVRYLELRGRDYEDIPNDIRHPFLNDLEEPETPQHIQITGYDSLKHLKLTQHLGTMADGDSVEWLDSSSLVCLIYFQKPFLLELAILGHDRVEGVHMTATYSSDSGLEFEYVAGLEKHKKWEDKIRTALRLCPNDIEGVLQIDQEDGHMVCNQDYHKVQKRISSERLPAFKEAWEKHFAMGF